MKRTNVILDEEKAREVRNLFGAPSISAAINMALEETLRVHRVRNLVGLFGKGIWDGDLGEMRDDAKSTPSKARKKKKRA
jgi:hypothetical protein